MLPDITPDEIRDEPEISLVERALADCVLRLALLGEIGTAKELVELFLENGSTVGTWIIDQFLKFAWEASGQWPEGWPSDRADIPPEEEYQQSRNASWMGLPKEKNDENRAVLDACLAVDDDIHADARSGASAMYKGQRLIRALELSVKLHNIQPKSKCTRNDRASKKSKDEEGQAVEQPNESDAQFKMSNLDKESAQILNKIVARLRANHQVKYLGEAKSLWPFWVRGLMADAVDMSQDEVRTKGQAFLEAFKDRFQRSYVPSRFAGKPIRELLEIGEKNTKHYLTAEEADMGSVPEALFKQAATDEEIERLEERLKTVLPDDYKEFLKITNGFGDDDSGIFNGYFPDPAFHDTSAVNWNEEEYFQLPVDLLELPREYEDLVGQEHKQSHPDGDFDWDTAFPIFDRVLEVGTRDIDNLWLVHPGLVEQAREQYHKMYVNGDEKQKNVIKRAMESFAGSKDAFESMHWCFAKWSSGGSASMTFYPSFTKYLEHIVDRSMENRYTGP
ncbi:hypothetical protein M409DRAFT_54755 [Zasmidium cellare ATCC 36951]|uniref:Knr4/Smi1-like domain-containing protein n=1 Tax=Zasmidium cellare ATCC 36951 TaxID=1080233 RepID=A0A6A6CIH2_ZASCE|nr:uncharacterized protein M409DRAFT_54755 [Zasmidium cellare ATCC 36951]KAF2166403.1 hypothetical protein M409DRAFT_54755 [Zasmidium cellare ATCC 36951]